MNLINLMMVLLLLQLHYFIPSLGMKYNLINFEPCEKCEENSQIFYEMEKKKFCPRCTLGHLSFYFPRQTVEAVKFYIADIIFDQIKHAQLQKSQIFIWSSVNFVVNDMINKELPNLEKQKYSTESCDLFVIVNEILKGMKQKILQKRSCSSCLNYRFHLIKVSCCKNFICVSCLANFRVKKRKCEICQNSLYRTKKEFDGLLKNLCLNTWRILGLDIKQREKGLQTAMNKIMYVHNKDLKDNTMQLKFASIIKYMDPQLSIEWTKIIEPEHESYKGWEVPTLTQKATTTFLTSLVQLSLVSMNAHNFIWIFINLFFGPYLVQWRNNKYPRPRINHEKIDKNIDDIELMIIIWFNYLLGFFLCGREVFCTHLELIGFFTSISVPLADKISILLKRFFHNYFKRKHKYQFF